MARKFIIIIGALFLLNLVMSGVALSQGTKMLCITNQDRKGEETIGSCVARGEEFAIVDQYGVVRILSPEEVALTKALNPQIFDQPAFGIKRSKEAPPLKIFGTVPVAPSK